MNKLKERKFRVLIGILALAVILGQAKNMLLRSIVRDRLISTMGTPVKINTYSFGLLIPQIKIQGLQILNPQDFPEGELLSVAKIHLKYRFGSLFKENLSFTQGVVNIKRLTIVRSRTGKINIDQLLFDENNNISLDVDEVLISIEKVIFKDQAAKGEEKADVFDVDVKKKKYKNIESTNHLMSLILHETLQTIPVGKLTSFGSVKVVGSTMASVAPAPKGLAGKDTVVADFNRSPQRVFNVSLKTISSMGLVNYQNQEAGQIKAKVQGVNIAIQIDKVAADKVRLSVSARRGSLPAPALAQNLIYQISKKL